jgi:hypothetical protein
MAKREGHRRRDTLFAQASVTLAAAVSFAAMGCSSSHSAQVSPDAGLTGGMTGAGGTSAADGSSGAPGCGASEIIYGFDSDDQGFAALYVAPSSLARSMDWDGSAGDPAPGSLSLSADFDGVDQSVMVGKTFSTSLDLTGKVLAAKVRLDQDPATGPGALTATGGTPDAPAGVRLYVKTGAEYHYASGAWVNLILGDWIPLELDPRNPDYVDKGDPTIVDAADIRELGVALSTAGAGTFAAAAWHVDSFAAQTGTSRRAPPWNFDCGTDGYGVTYVSSASLAPSVTWDGIAGSPDPGSLVVAAAFSSAGQEMGLARVIGGTGIDLSGKTLTARIRLDTGLSTDAANLASARLYVVTSSQWLCGIGQAVKLSPGGDWVTLTLPVDSPNYTCTSSTGAYDATQVMELGVDINTGARGTYTAGTLHVDSISTSP